MIQKTVSFCAGKVHVYSDYDGTYLPARHASLHNTSGNEHMTEYSQRMGRFFKSTKNDLDFHITTGRTYGEFDSVSWLVKMRNFPLPLPDSVIAKNGSDEYIRQGTDEDFYQRGIFPFSYNHTNKQKEDLIRQETNWDGQKIKAFVKEKAKAWGIRLVEADSEHSTRDYGNRSLYSEGKLRKDAGQYRTIGSRNDGNLKLHFIFSPDYGPNQDSNKIYDVFMNDLKNYLKENNVKYDIAWEEANKRNHYHIACDITPMVEKGPLTKLFDTKLSVKQAKAANDLVVVAGDGSNDFQMLNPLEYIDKKFIAECADKSKHVEIYQDGHQMLNALNQIFRRNSQNIYYREIKEELTANGLLKKLQDLPLCSIVVRKDVSEFNPLEPLVYAFSNLGKVIEVEAGRIDEGIKEAIGKYANTHENFRNSIGESLKSFISGIREKTEEIFVPPAQTVPPIISENVKSTAEASTNSTIAPPVIPKTPLNISTSETEKPISNASKKLAQTGKKVSKQAKIAIGIIAGALVFIAGAYAYLRSIKTTKNANRQ